LCDYRNWVKWLRDFGRRRRRFSRFCGNHITNGCVFPSSWAAELAGAAEILEIGTQPSIVGGVQHDSALVSSNLFGGVAERCAFLGSGMSVVSRGEPAA
jgi:hypothetical protein